MTAPADPAPSAAVPQSTAHPTFVSYIDKSRQYYAAHGYDTPYRWASHREVPFTPLSKPLSACRVGLVTTSGIHQDDKPADAPPPLPKRAFAWPTDPAPVRLFTDDLSWDKEATHTDDVETFLPIARLRELQAEGRIGAVADRFYGVPTEYSRRKTAADAETIERWCREDEVDVVLLIPL